MSKIGIDLGGTKIEGILLDNNLNTIERKRIPTQQENGYKSIIDSISPGGWHGLRKGSDANPIARPRIEPAGLNKAPSVTQKLRRAVVRNT